MAKTGSFAGHLTKMVKLQFVLNIKFQQTVPCIYFPFLIHMCSSYCTIETSVRVITTFPFVAI
jgi:hypothetical protein